MLHHRSFACLVVGALLILAGSAAAQDTIKIGVITDHSGPSKFYAELATQGVQLAAKEINAKGGVLGKKIELLIEDDQGKPDVSATRATQQAETVSLETKTPQLAPANGGDTLTTQLDDPWFFQTGPLASDQLLTLLAYANLYFALASDEDGSGETHG
jgi:branched-chain amino acid transport system substrate-binding protein